MEVSAAAGMPVDFVGIWNVPILKFVYTIPIVRKNHRYFESGSQALNGEIRAPSFIKGTTGICLRTTETLEFRTRLWQLLCRIDRSDSTVLRTLLWQGGASCEG
jgi:hypothetical protein